MKIAFKERKGKTMKRKRIKIFLKAFTKAAAAVTAAVCTAVMGFVGYYEQALPDCYTTASGGELSFNTILPITADAKEESITVYSESEILSVTTKTAELELFGSIPIKEVKEETVNRPMLMVCGNAFGIKLVTDGVMIIDMKEISGSCPAEEAGLEVGDVIEAINGERVTSNSQVSEIIKDSGGEECIVKYRRNDEEHECSVRPVLNEGSYCAGMWVRDSSAGIGTITFIDPETGVFAGLGHAVCDNDTHDPLPLSDGSISDVKINGYTKSEKGDPGQLIGEFCGSQTGSLLLNCDGGVYGVTDEYDDGELYELGFSSEIKLGKAYIIAQIDDGEPQQFEISIEKVSPSDSEHDLVIKVTDERLIRMTGGIVQGMSGSPIIQDGRLVGAVTHVFVDDPTGGYGIFADRMYEYSQSLSSDGEELAG